MVKTKPTKKNQKRQPTTMLTRATAKRQSVHLNPGLPHLRRSSDHQATGITIYACLLHAVLQQHTSCSTMASQPGARKNFQAQKVPQSGENISWLRSYGTS